METDIRNRLLMAGALKSACSGTFKVKDIWALRVRLQMEGWARELALFNLGIDSKLRGRDLVALKLRDVSPHSGTRQYARILGHCHSDLRPERLCALLLAIRAARTQATATPCIEASVKG